MDAQGLSSARLPKRIRTDNGVPFATNTLARRSTLSAWWVHLGVLPELIEPGKPRHRAPRAYAPHPQGRDDPAPAGRNLRSRIGCDRAGQLSGSY
jgi:hypothetical protein